MSSNSFIALCEPFLDGNEWTYVKDCLDTGWVSSVGSYVERFERDVARCAGRQYGVATTCGTAALHIALMVAGVEAGDEVLISTLTFIAPANAIQYIGAHPVFLDAEPVYWQIDPQVLADFLANDCERRDGHLFRKATGRRVAAIVPVHILGHPVEIDTIVALARQYGLKVIEDSTEALGSKYKGAPVGAHGDIACYSFNGNKILTTGGGGVIVTDDAAMAARARHLTTQAKRDAVEFIHDEVGFNYRLTNVQAAMGCAQVENLDRYVEKKRSIARNYIDAFTGLPGVSWQQESPDAHSNCWLFTMRLHPEAPVASRPLMAALQQQKIQARPLWQPIHLSKAHASTAPAPACPVAETLNDECLSLPSSVGLSSESQQRVIDAILAFFRAETAAPL